MNILHVISSPRTDSYSHRLGNAIIEKLLAAHPGSTVRERNLAEHPFPHLEEASIQSFNTPADQHTPGQQAAIRRSDEVIAEVQDAEVLVVDAPLYNFSIPSTLKAWIDHLARRGVTFRYTANGPEGLLKDKKVYVAMASGGVYSEGPAAGYDFVAPYLRTIFGFLGLTDVTIARAEGVANPELEPTAIQKGLESVSV